MLDKNEVLHLWERWDGASTTKVIHFVGDYPTSMSASLVCQVVCESNLIIHKLQSCILDTKRSITFVGAIWCSLFYKCNTFVSLRSSMSLFASSVCQVVLESTLIIQFH